MYLLNELNTFTRKQGSKDKQKRKSRLGLLGAVAGTTTGVGIAKGTNKKKIVSELKKQNLDTEGIKKQISTVTRNNASIYKNVISPSAKFLEDLDNIAPTGNLENDLRRQIKTKSENATRIKTLGKTNASNRKIFRNVLKTQASNLKKKIARNRIIKGAALGLGVGMLAGKSMDYFLNKNSK